jgi:hypothetical protein
LAHDVLYVDTTFFSASRISVSAIARPYVQSVAPQRASFRDGTQLYITGQFFGESAADVIAIYAGIWPCTDVKWLSKTELLCRAPVFNDDQLEELGFDTSDERTNGTLLRPRCSQSLQGSSRTTLWLKRRQAAARRFL